MTGHVRVGAIVGVSLVAAIALHSAGPGTLGAPPLGSWADLEGWYEDRGAATAVVSLVRLLGCGLGAWLALAGVLQLLAPLVGRAGFSAVVDAVSPRVVRALTTGAAGLSVTAGLSLPTLPSAPIENPPGTALMVPLEVGPPLMTSTSTTTSTTTPTTTTASAPPVRTPVTATPVEPAPVTAAPDAAAPADRPDEVVVAAGDSFWSIAVDEAGHRDLDGYWRALIDLNRDRLVDPENPDLLYTGQVLRLP